MVIFNSYVKLPEGIKQFSSLGYDIEIVGVPFFLKKVSLQFWVPRNQDFDVGSVSQPWEARRRSLEGMGSRTLGAKKEQISWAILGMISCMVKWGPRGPMFFPIFQGIQL
jgi:hypothetical protein